MQVHLFSDIHIKYCVNTFKNVTLSYSLFTNRKNTIKMKTMRIRKWMILSFTLISLACICLVGCNNTDETPLELLMLVSVNIDHENCLEKAESSKDKKQCEITRKKVLDQIQLRDVANRIPRGFSDDEFPCPIGDCPEDLIARLRDDWQSTLSKVVLRKGQIATVRGSKGNVIAKLAPGAKQSEVFKNHSIGDLKIIEQGSQVATKIIIDDKNTKSQFTVKIPSK